MNAVGLSQQQSNHLPADVGLTGAFGSFTAFSIATCNWGIYGARVAKNDNIENFQKRVLRIIYGYAFTYTELLILSGIEIFYKRRDYRCSRLLHQMYHPSRCVNHLLPV